MRILVTGAAGLIGSSVAARLASQHDVIGLDLNPGPQVGIVADCNEVAEWRHLVGHVDSVVHVAALHAPHVGKRSDEEFRRTNIDATSRLLDFAFASGADHFVLTSTTSIYGHEGFKIHQGEDKLATYRFNTRTAERHFCTVCGIYTHHKRRSNPNQLGVNTACLEGLSPFDFRKVVVYDGQRHPGDNPTHTTYTAGTLTFTPADLAYP